MSNLSEFVGGGRLCTQEFLSSGTFTPSARLLALGGVVLVEALGAGASGSVQWSTVAAQASGGCSGGDAGQLVEQIVTVTGPVAVTIGAGGARASVTSAGLATGLPGGSTSFGSLVTAAGGTCPLTISGSTYIAKGGAGARTPGGSSRTEAWLLDTQGGRGIGGRAGGGAAASAVTAAAGASPAFDGGGAGMYVAAAVTADVLGNSAAPNSGAGGGAVMCPQNPTAFAVKSGAGGSGWLRATWFE